MLFALLLQCSAILSVCVCLFRALKTVYPWCGSAAWPGIDWPYYGNCPINSFAKIFHYNLQGYYAINSSGLHYGQAAVCEQPTKNGDLLCHLIYMKNGIKCERDHRGLTHVKNNPVPPIVIYYYMCIQTYGNDTFYDQLREILQIT